MSGALRQFSARKAAAAGGFSPSDLSGLVGWWKADAITGLSNGEAVASWPDSSTASTPLSQDTSAQRPTYRTAGPNGEPYVEFDGNETAGQADFLTRSRLYTDDIFVTFFVVRAAAQSNKAMWAQHDGNADVGRTISGTGFTNTDRARFFFNNGSSHAAETTTVVFNSTWNILQVASDGAGNTASRVNAGADEATITGETWTPNNVPFSVGALANGSSNNAYAGDIAEIVCYDVHHNNTDRDAVVSYLQAKYGL